MFSYRRPIVIYLFCTTVIYCEDAKPQRVWNQDPDFLGSHDVIGHVTTGLAVGTFLLVVNDEHASILHRYGDIKPQSCV